MHGAYSPGADVSWNYPQPFQNVHILFTGRAVSYLVTNISVHVCMTWKAGEAHCFFTVQSVYSPRMLLFPDNCQGSGIASPSAIRVLWSFVHWWLILSVLLYCHFPIDCEFLQNKNRPFYHSGPQSFAYLGGGTHFSDANKMGEGHCHILISSTCHLKCFEFNLLF